MSLDINVQYGNIPIHCLRPSCAMVTVQILTSFKLFVLPFHEPDRTYAPGGGQTHIKCVLQISSRHNGRITSRKSTSGF